MKRKKPLLRKGVVTSMYYSPILPNEVANRFYTGDRFLFIMHRRPDGDAVGSAAALMHILRAMGKTVFGVCEDKIPTRLAFLTEGLDIRTTLPEGPFLPVAIDVAAPEQLGKVADMLKEAGASVFMMIDHHAVGTPFAPYLTVPSAAAAGEVVFSVAEVFLKKKRLPDLPAEAKMALYAALSSDTGCFRYSNVTPNTLRTAAALLENNAVDAAEVNRLLFETKSPEQLRAEAFAIEHTKASPDGKLAFVAITMADKKAMGVEEEHLETVIDVVRSRAGVEIAVSIRELPDGRYKASFRSSGFNVADVAAAFGGGGHLRAAGCTLEAPSAQAAVESVLSEIEKQKSGEKV